MLLIWGTRTTRRRLGRVATFCPICRDFRVHRLHRIGSVAHFYWIPLGANRLAGHEATCEDCGTSFDVRIDSFTAVSKDSAADLERLISETNPDLKEKAAGRLEHERLLREGRIEPEVRMDALAEPFVMLEPEAEVRASQTHIDGRSGLGCLATLVSIYGLVMVGIHVGGPAENALGILAAVVAVVGLTGVGYRLATDKSRFVRQRLHPRLVRALRPLRPTHEELSRVVDRLRSKELVLGKSVNVDRLWQELQVPPDAAPIVPRR